MRLAANMTGGHIAILAILSFVFLFAEMFGHAIGGVGVGLRFRCPRGRNLWAGNHRRTRSGLRLYAVDGSFHWNGHSRTSLKMGQTLSGEIGKRGLTPFSSKGQRMNSVRVVRKPVVIAMFAFAFAMIASNSVLLAQGQTAAPAAGQSMALPISARLLGSAWSSLVRGLDREVRGRCRRRDRAPAGRGRQITGAVNLPLFLLEGVAILAEVFVLLIVLTK